jgi:hypothetical protein
MLTYADVCRMLTYADVCWRMQVLHFVAGLTSLALAPYADVCYADELRMLTYAGVCWRAGAAFCGWSDEPGASSRANLRHVFRQVTA